MAPFGIRYVCIRAKFFQPPTSEVFLCTHCFLSQTTQLARNLSIPFFLHTAERSDLPGSQDYEQLCSGCRSRLYHVRPAESCRECSSHL